MILCINKYHLLKNKPSKYPWICPRKCPRSPRKMSSKKFSRTFFKKFEDSGNHGLNGKRSNFLLPVTLEMVCPLNFTPKKVYLVLYKIPWFFHKNETKKQMESETVSYIYIYIYILGENEPTNIYVYLFAINFVYFTHHQAS